MTSRLSSLIAVACFVLPVATWAQINPPAGKTACVVGGKTYYQNGPCPPGAQGVPATAQAIDPTSPTGKAEARDLYCANNPTVVILIGMEEARLQCIDKYRDPDMVNVTTTARGTRKQYVFRGIGEYLYVENGVVTSMQGQQR